MRARIYQSDVITVPDGNVQVPLKIRRLKRFNSDGTFTVLRRETIQKAVR